MRLPFTQPTPADGDRHGIDSDYTGRLLRYLRAPSEALDRADEQLDLSGDEVKRTVLCVFKSGALEEGAVVDLLRPKKGSISELEIVDSSANFKRMPHHQHVSISRDLVYRRFTQLLRTVAVPSGATYHRDEVLAELVAFLQDAVGVIEVHPDDAELKMAEMWVEVRGSGMRYMSARRIAKFDGLSVDPRELAWLYSLCKMLSTHYLSLYQVGSVGEVVSVTYRYSHALSRSPEEKRIGKPTKFFRAGTRRLLQSLPVDARIHVPLAKKANHYSMMMAPPKHYIVYKAVVLADVTNEQRRPEGIGRLWHRNKSGVSTVREGWSATLKHGRSAAVFVGNGSKHPDRLYLGLKFAAEPWGATARTLMSTSLQLVTFAVFAFFLVGATPPPTGVSALTVSVLALMASLIRDEFPSDSLFQSPLQSKIVRLLSMYSVVPFVGWILSRGTTYHWGWQWFARAWPYWTTYGGLALTALMGCLVFASLRRFTITLGRLNYVISGKANRNSLYKRLGG